jgi:hypothetical protein
VEVSIGGYPSPSFHRMHPINSCTTTNTLNKATCACRDKHPTVPTEELRRQTQFISAVLSLSGSRHGTLVQR